MGTRSDAHSWFNSYAPELVPMVYYRVNTRVQLFYFLNNLSREYVLILWTVNAGICKIIAIQ